MDRGITVSGRARRAAAEATAAKAARRRVSGTHMRRLALCPQPQLGSYCGTEGMLYAGAASKRAGETPCIARASLQNAPEIRSPPNRKPGV